MDHHCETFKTAGGGFVCINSQADYKTHTEMQGTLHSQNSLQNNWHQGSAVWHVGQLNKIGSSEIEPHILVYFWQKYPIIQW